MVRLIVQWKQYGKIDVSVPWALSLALLVKLL
jgi:hypothetical protein